MAFDGSEGGQISLDEGAQLTKNYRNANSDGILAHFFGKDILHELLSQEGCMGIRVYYGLNSHGAQELVLVGADSSENDMTNLVADLSAPCPSRCGRANKLNS